MLNYAASRLLQVIPVMVIVTLIVFLLMSLVPGDPVLVLAGFGPEDRQGISQEQYDALVNRLGLDQPIHVRYFQWLGNIFRGDWGISLTSQRPVLTELLSRYPATIYLAASAMLVTLFMAIPLSILAARFQNKIPDYSAMSFAVLGLSIPNFWLGLILILVFSLHLGWLPSIGYADPFDQPLEFLRHIILPAVVLGAASAAQLTRYLRSGMLEQLGEDYIRMAYAKGLPELLIMFKYAFRNSLIAAITVIGLEIGQLLGGSTIVEVLFGWPGVAKMLLDGIYSRDFPLIQGAVLVLAATYVLVNLLVDLLYRWIDPRVRFS
ncbi:MAG: ABC transporter permease subunit [Chloroflexi bacterium]|nr:ABC transporter permease subunit [Chloroflexota bacterium]